MAELWRTRTWLALAAVLAVLMAGCGGSGGGHGRSTGAEEPLTASSAPSSAGVAGNGRFSQAAGICRGFVDHINLQLHAGIGRIGPGAGVALYAELEGLSRRLGFLSVPAASRLRLVRFAADLDRAASTAQAMTSQETTSPASLRRFIQTRDRLQRELISANAAARALGLGACVINLRGRLG